MSFVAKAIIGGIGELGGRVATPIADAWARSKESAAATHQVDRQTDRDITVASFQADTRHAELQTVLANADRADPRTAWIRPVASAIALYVFACVALEHTQPRLAALLWIQTRDLPMPWGYLCAGIVGALFALRPLEKKWRAATVTTAHGSIVKAQTGPALARNPNRRADDM
jgi:hypothetical protein